MSFQVDAHYVGVVPPRELTFSNLNDNIDEEFLNKMCAKFGQLDQVKIYVNPDTRKSMGLAKVKGGGREERCSNIGSFGFCCCGECATRTRKIFVVSMAYVSLLSCQLRFAEDHLHIVVVYFVSCINYTLDLDETQGV